MNTLCMGLPFGIELDLLSRYQSRHGHGIRTLAVEGPADFHFLAEETACEAIARIRRDWPVDTLICWVPELFPPPRAVEECRVRTVAAVSDWNLYFPQLEHNAARFDLVLTDKLGTQALRLPYTAPTYLGPLYSHHPARHYDESLPRTVDVLFAGNLNPTVHVDRGRVLERVATLAGTWNVLMTAGLDAAEYRTALNTARIVVNYGLRHEMNLRCFETLACGALLFMEEDNLEIRDLLEEGEHFVSYRMDTLCEQLDRYLTEEDARRRVAAQGHRRVQDICGDKRLDGLFDGIATLGAGIRPYRYLNDAQRRLADCMLYASSHVASQRALARRLAYDAAVEFPQDPAIVTASALVDVEHATGLPRGERHSVVQDILRRLQRVTAMHPDAIVPWLNLAFVCRRSNVPESELRFLELALEAKTADLGGLLLGSMDDPYYVAWRRGLATGEGDVALLHAYAHARLAAILLGQGKHREALDHAECSRELRPGFAPAYRAAGRASLDLGLPDRAAEILHEGLQHTSFDAEMRLTLLHALHDAGDGVALRHLAFDSARLFETAPKMAHLAATFREYC